MERPKTRPLIPFEGTGCNGVPSTATNLDFGLAQHAHDAEACIPGGNRFSDRFTSGYGCSDQLASNWENPYRHRLYLLFKLDIHLTLSDINASYLIQETQIEDAPSTYDSQILPTPPHGLSHTQLKPKVTVAVLDNITNAMNRLTIQAIGLPNRYEYTSFTTI